MLNTISPDPYVQIAFIVGIVAVLIFFRAAKAGKDRTVDDFRDRLTRAEASMNACYEKMRDVRDILAKAEAAKK